MSGPKMTLVEHTTALASNLPSGRLWVAKYRQGSNLFKLLFGFAATFRRMDEANQRFVDQSFPPETIDFLEEWEAALGLPDDCLPIAADTATRQRNILIKYVLLGGIQTEADFVALALLFGLVVTVNSGIEHLVAGDGGYELFGPAMNIPADFADVKQARFTMVVVEVLPARSTFDYDFPILFTSADQQQMRCLFEKLAPANVDVVFVTAP
jgi:uncharacterized protein YmfQ (DUF2313 family)